VVIYYYYLIIVISIILFIYILLGAVPIHLSAESLFLFVTSPHNMWLQMLDAHTVKHAIIFNGNFVNLCIVCERITFLNKKKKFLSN
jgi:hypothetical protein